ncbi:MAG: DUF2085 domain-containing protein [Candidatus Micrarchaeota archaeon]
MQRPQIVYLAYVLIFTIVVASFFAVPLMAFSQDMGGVYKGVRDAAICHQKISRSLCVFRGDGGYWISDCTAQNGTYVTERDDRITLKVVEGTTIGYKMPVCARDFGIYGAMLLAALAYPFVRRLDDRDMLPAVYLLLALVPMGLDGGIQLASDLGWVPFAYESTNLIRLLTGAVAGGTASFYAIPLLIGMAARDKGKP